MAEKEYDDAAIENADGIAYDRILPDLPQITNFADCVVHVRPHKKWQGEDFGFDWMRIGDSGIKGDVKYAENMGKYWDGKKMQENPNKDESTFKEDAAIYNKLVNDYFPNPKDISWIKSSQKVKTNEKPLDTIKREAKFKYFVPVMTLRKGKTATLNLIVDYDPDKTKALPKRIEVLSSDKSKLKPDKPEPITTIERKKGEFELKIECLDTFYKEQCIAFVAVYDNADGTECEEYCGFLRVLPNHRIRKLKVVCINLKFKNTIGKDVEGEIKKIDTDEIKKILNQALVDLEYNVIPIQHVVPNTQEINFTLNPSLEEQERNAILGETSPIPQNKKISNSANKILQSESTSGWFKDSGTLTRYVFGEQGGVYYNHPELRNRYKYHIPIVALGYECKEVTAEEESRTNGSTTDGLPVVTPITGGTYTPKTKKIILFDKRKPETAAHELLHAVGLLHTFSTDQDYTYRSKCTENIMDYSDKNNPIPRFDTWHWQWKALWKYIDDIDSQESAALNALPGNGEVIPFNINIPTP